MIRSFQEEAGTPAYEVLEKYTGKDLEYKEYEPLYACAGEAAAKQKKKAFFVTCDDYVTLTDGTGVVHIAPAFTVSLLRTRSSRTAVILMNQDSRA